MPSYSKLRLALIIVPLTACLSILLFNFEAQAVRAQRESRGQGTIKVKNESGGEFNLYDGSYALIIGNSEYSLGWDRLSGVTNDVIAVRDVLKKHGFKVEVEENLTSERFERRIKKFINDYGYARNNRLLIYYAGHGYTLNSAGDKREVGYIIPADTPLPTKDEFEFRQKAVSMYAIQTFAKEIQAKHALFIFDSCFSGKLFALRDTLKIPPFIAENIDYPVRQFITAGDATQTVPDESTFRKAFVRGLEGEANRNNDDYITVTELAAYLKETVTNRTERRQAPQYGTLNDIDLDRGDLVFAALHKPTVAQVETAWSKFRGLARALVKYDFIGAFSDGSAPVRLDNKWGFIDQSGRLTIPIKYDNVYMFSEGLAPVSLNKKWTFVDTGGKELFPPKYDAVHQFSEGIAAVKLNEKWGYIDKIGRVVIPIKYEAAHQSSQRLLAVKMNERFGFIDQAGKVVIPFKYGEARNFAEGLAAVSTSDQNSFSSFEFIDRSGNVIIPSGYDTAGTFSEGLVEVGLQDDERAKSTEDGFYMPNNLGFINKSGKVVAEIKYHDTQPFSEGRAVVVKDDKQGYIDKNGVEVIPLRYDVDECGCQRNSFSGGLALVTLRKKFGFIDIRGREVVPVKYDLVWCYAFKSEGFIGVTVNGKRGFVDLNGIEYFDF